MSTHPLEEILHPQSIAVVGASGNTGTQGYAFVSSLLKLDFKGKIYPVNPKYPEILGLKTYPTLKEIPTSVDFVISCIPAPEVPGMMEDCSKKGVKGVHLYTARFSETGRGEAAELEKRILKQARAAGIRIIGPNCMGVYNPRHGVSWRDDFPKESGTVGLASQSGGHARRIVYLASVRGVYFSKAISYGNAIDFNECDLLEYFAEDPVTKIILMYVEGVKDGKRFANALRHAAASKPVIITKGGRGKSGTRAAASHTASLAGSSEIWSSLITQAGAVPAENLDDMMDFAVAFYFLPTILGRRVGVSGGGGGACVLAADECEESGLDVVPLPDKIRQEMKDRGIPTWDWVSNPADMSITGNGTFKPADMLQMMNRHQSFDLLIANMREYQGTSVEACLAEYSLKDDNRKPLLVVTPDENLALDDIARWQTICAVKTKLLADGIPFYPTVKRAATAASKLIDYYRRRE